MKHTVKKLFPGFTGKSVTFTIDDGNTVYDKKFIDIVRPKGIKGTFNLCSHNVSAMSPEEYRKFYSGFEIANHCKYHPFAFDDSKTYEKSTEKFSPETSDGRYIYESGTAGLYHFKAPQGWRMVADSESYVRFASESKKELEDIFGEGSVTGFVWPYCRQNNSFVFESLKKAGYYGIRTTGDRADRDNFGVPKDRMNWSYNAGDRSLLRIADMYEKAENKGELQMFSFGVHSIDFERNGTWKDLELFAEKFGGKPDKYYYASVKDIFAYQDAMDKCVINENCMENLSDFTLYFEVDCKNVKLPAHGKSEF